LKNTKTLDQNFIKILDRASEGEKLTVEEGKRLLKSSGREVEKLVKTADTVRKEQVGETVTYVVNRNINFTNICRGSCKFCAFRREEDNPESFTLGKKEVTEKTRSAVEKGATEICFQGGLNPHLSFEDYIEYLKAIRSASEEIHIHSYSPAEIDHMSKASGLDIEEIILKLRDAGLDSVPGTAAEILVDKVRRVICPNKITAGRWEEIIRTLHRLKVPTTATIMYGHVETPKEIAFHLAKIREIQMETGGFTELVPLPFAKENTKLQEKGLVQNLSEEDHLKVHAVARLMLANHVPNIQTSWVKLSPKMAQMMLNAGANDFSGTLIEENITRAAGGEYQKLKPEEIRELIRKTGRIPRERNTTYQLISRKAAKTETVLRGAKSKFDE